MMLHSPSFRTAHKDNAWGVVPTPDPAEAAGWIEKSDHSAKSCKSHRFRRVPLPGWAVRTICTHGSAINRSPSPGRRWPGWIVRKSRRQPASLHSGFHRHCRSYLRGAGRRRRSDVQCQLCLRGRLVLRRRQQQLEAAGLFNGQAYGSESR